jgi:DNA-binding CsgD family transcriptional regulator
MSLARAPRHVPPPGSDADPSLIERAAELDAVAAAVERLSALEGGVITVEAAAGLGKTTLVEQAVRLAAGAGCLVRRAAPSPLERHFPYGVIRALLEPPVREAGPTERARLLDGVAGRAGELLLDGTMPGADATTLVAHSLLWLCSGLAEERPLALVVDDAQWADRSSLEALSFLARRIADLPLLLVVASRADDPDAASDLLSMLGDGTATTTLRPQALTAGGSVRLVRRLAPDTPVDVCRRCHVAAHGNPWLVAELGRQVAAHGITAIDPREDGARPPSDVALGVVRRRVAALAPRDRAVVAAFSVVGDAAAPHVVAAVADVPVGELGQARDALVAAGLLGPERDRFAHALIGAAIGADLSGGERERLHRVAARTLIAAGARDDVVASHLLQCAPHADPEVSALLARAAGDAWEHGAAHTAAAYLQRAVDERAPGDDHGRMLAQLATFAFDAGLPDARLRLREALGTARDRESRIDILTRLAALNTVDTSDPGLTQLLERERASESDPDVRLALEVAVLDTLLMLPERLAERARRAGVADAAGATDPLLRRVLLAHRAWLASEVGAPDAARCARLALDALDGGLLLAEARRRAAFHLCVRALVRADRVDDAERTIDAMREDAIARGSLRLRAGAAWYGADLALRRGRIADAENEARLVLDLVDEDVNMFTGGAVEALVRALAERGAFGEARALLRERDLDGDVGARIWEIGILYSRARLALLEGDYERALAEALRVGELRDGQGRPNPTWAAWRSTAALALAHLGRSDEAIGLADAELALAEAFGAPVPIVAALHARIVAEPRAQARVALAERALAVADGSPALLESARVRVELGSALRRLGKRIDARVALQRALADADSVGAIVLAEQARRELVATGLRPRRAQVEGPGALTPRQRQVCELAAAGAANRDIAQRLFLSVKTVETHLATSYRKLGIETREDLAAELARAAP